MDFSMPGFPVIHVFWSLLKPMSIELVMPSKHLILCHPLLPLPLIFPSIRVFSNELALCIRWPKYIGASASTSLLPMNNQGWFPLGLTGLISLKSKGQSKVFSSVTVWRHHFFSAQLTWWSSSHICPWLPENHSFDYMSLYWQSTVCAFEHTV